MEWSDLTRNFDNFSDKNCFNGKYIEQILPLSLHIFALQGSVCKLADLPRRCKYVLRMLGCIHFGLVCVCPNVLRVSLGVPTGRAGQFGVIYTTLGRKTRRAGLL